MIDLHCHVLPGVDDGAADLEAGLAMARAAVANGIDVAVLTPHVYPGRWNNTRSTLLPRFAAFQESLALNRIPLEILLGAEVHLLPESLALYEAGELPSLGRIDGHDVVLLELPDAGIPIGALKAIDFMISRGARPMIAHPERNKEIMQSPARLAPLVSAGCLVQLTAASVCGWFGIAAQRTAHAILEAVWVTVVATDAHNLRHRPPVLAEARHALMARYGEDTARSLTETNPALIVCDRPEMHIA